MPRSLDKDSLGIGLLLDLPFREGMGILGTADVAKPHHPVGMTHSPAWGALASGQTYLDLDGANDYLQCASASCTDLDFTTGDFTIACWTYWEGDSSDIIVGRYELDVSGWEVYYDDGDPLRTLSLRLSHGGVPARTGCYSYGWTKSNWWLMGISKSGAYPGVYPLMYRNGWAVEMNYSAGGFLTAPGSCANNLYIGCNNGHTANHYHGRLSGLRIWGRNLSPSEHMELFNRERGFYDV